MTTKLVRHESAGFTLIEVLIVASVISILASVAVPNLMRGRAAANEAAVIATLKSIAKAQFQFKVLNLVDVNGDSVFEYGSMRELTGKLPLRGTVEKLAPALLGISLAEINANGHLARHGYLFAHYLPGPGSVGVGENAISSSSVDPLLAVDYWTCLAWPQSRGQTGRATFFVNQQGQIMRADKTTYSGAASVPPAGAALVGVPSAQIASQSLAVAAIGADGSFWVPVH